MLKDFPLLLSVRGLLGAPAAQGPEDWVEVLQAL